ncbi:MAG: peptide ABC transporter substrate-binding protein [Alphaproteobacteria bacterium]|nr:peptide ABC transporter substrate-binding protein [Alphaproteobacteria bacterium]
MMRNFGTMSLMRFCAALLFCLAVAMPASAEKILHRGNGAEPKGLDPHQASGDPENQILGDLMVGLYTEDVKGKAILGAAEKVETSPDGLTWTFTIRDHKWSDGVAVTADDFVYSYRRILDPKIASEYASILYPIKNAELVNTGKLPLEQLGVSAPNPKTFVIQLAHPAAYLPEMMTHYSTFALPKHVVEKYGFDWVKPGVMVSNGAYMLAARRPNDHIKLVKNPYFYDAANVKIDEVYFYPTTDEGSALKRYRAGELDTLDRWPLTEYKWLQASIPNEVRKYPGLRVLYTVFNMRKPPLNDRRVRLALAEAIDRVAIQKSVYFNVHGIEARNVLPPGMANVDLSAQVPWAGKTMEERQADARALLKAAGFGPENPLKLTYNFNNRPDTKRNAIAMQNMWKQVGVNVELNAKDFAIHYDLLKTGEFQLGEAGWVFDYNDAQSVLFLFESSTQQLNYPGYKNPAYDDLMHRAENEKDAVARGKLLGQAAGLLINDVAVGPTFFQYIRPLVKSYVLNWEETPRGVNRTRWLDIGDKPGPGATANGTDDGAQASEGGFWSWLGSWFSADAWSKWWNS